MLSHYTSHFDLTDSHDVQITPFAKETDMEYFLLVTYPILHAMTQGKMFSPHSPLWHPST